MFIRNRKIIQMLILFFFSFLLSLCLHEIIVPIADFFLPVKELNIRMLEPYKAGQGVMIYNEGKPNEIFGFLKDAVNNKECGWKYIKGEKGVSWTKLVTTNAGSVITAQVGENPEYFFTCHKSRWDCDFEYWITGMSEPVIINCYDDNSEGELIQVYPFIDSSNKLVWLFQIIAHILVTILLFITLTLLNKWFITQFQPI